MVIGDVFFFSLFYFLPGAGPARLAFARVDVATLTGTYGGQKNMKNY